MSIDLETLAAIGTQELTLPELTPQWSDGARALLGQTLPETFAAVRVGLAAPDRPPDGPPAALDDDALRGLVQQLEPAEADAVERYQQLKPGLAGRLGAARATTLTAAIERLHFDEASGLLRGLPRVS
jgi:hypothetical protein